MGLKHLIGSIILTAALVGGKVCAAENTTTQDTANVTVLFKTGEVVDCKLVSKDEKTVVLEGPFFYPFFPKTMKDGRIQISANKILKVEAESDGDKKVRDAAEAFAAQMKAEGKVLCGGKWISKQDMEQKSAAKKAKAKQVADSSKSKTAQSGSNKGITRIGPALYTQEDYDKFFGNDNGNYSDGNGAQRSGLDKLIGQAFGGLRH
jgi:hypothetical protein